METEPIIVTHMRGCVSDDQDAEFQMQLSWDVPEHYKGMEYETWSLECSKGKGWEVVGWAYSVPDDLRLEFGTDYMAAITKFREIIADEKRKARA